MTDRTPLRLSEHGMCLAEGFQARIEHLPKMLLTLDTIAGARKRPVVRVSVNGAAYLADAVTGTLYDPETGFRVGMGDGRLNLLDSGRRAKAK